MVYERAAASRVDAAMEAPVGILAYQRCEQSESRVPVVVIGGELNALGVCRSLAKGGMPIWVVGRKRSNPALWSRHAKAAVAPTLHGPDFVAFLRDLQHRIGEPAFLIVTDELALLTVSEHRNELEGLYYFRLPPHDRMLLLHDKASFHEHAMKHGWPVPNGVIVRTPADLSKIASLRPPMILKPADKRHFHEGRAPRLITVNSHVDSLSKCEELLARARKVVVQEIIEGPDDNIYFCLFYRGRHGETVGMFTGQKLASTPPGTGSTLFCIPALNPDLERAATTLLDEVKYVGFGSVEYKWDPLTGRFLIIEPTVGRTDWQEEVATLAGINIPLMAYRHELGLQPFPALQVEPLNLWQASWIDRIRVGSTPIPRRSVVVDGYWRCEDPVPALVYYGFRATCSLVSRARRRLGRLRRKLVTTSIGDVRVERPGHS